MKLQSGRLKNKEERKDTVLHKMCSESAQSSCAARCTSLHEVKKWSDVRSFCRQGMKKRRDVFLSQGVLQDPLWMIKGPFSKGKTVCDPCLSTSVQYHQSLCTLLDSGHWQPTESFLFSCDTFRLLLLIFYYTSIDGYRGLGDGIYCGLGSKPSADTSVHLHAKWKWWPSLF